jgi:hypothetical protein
MHRQGNSVPSATCSKHFFFDAVSHKDRNIILAGTHEYRHPPSSAVMAAVEQQAEDGMTRLNMSSRFVGLVVVPGAYITKIEVEEHPLEGIGEGER